MINTMLVGRNDQKYIRSDKDFRNRLLRFYSYTIQYAKDLQLGNFPHGMSSMRYYLKHTNTILHLRCDDEELKTRAHNIAVVGDSLYLGLYPPSEKLQKLKEIATECEYLKGRISMGV